jgi:acetyltransferase-like isoleucine patch superfamily enzyme
VLTHSIDLMRDKYVTGPVVLGAYARVPARSIVSAGSVVTTKLTQELTLYRGNPAEPVRPLSENLRFLRRGEPRTS